jgi:hypothetical protein
MRSDFDPVAVVAHSLSHEQEIARVKVRHEHVVQHDAVVGLRKFVIAVTFGHLFCSPQTSGPWRLKAKSMKKQEHVKRLVGRTLVDSGLLLTAAA